MKRMSILSLSLACSIALPLLPVAAHERSDSPSVTKTSTAEAFRVLPYLQKPAQDQMTIIWFTESAEPGTLTMNGPGLRGRFTETSTPEYQPLLDYTDAERAETIEGLEQGSWLQGEKN